MNKRLLLAISLTVAVAAVAAAVLLNSSLLEKKKNTVESESKPFGYEALKINGSYVSSDIFEEERNIFFNRYKRDAEMLQKTDEERNDLLLEQIIERVVMDDYFANKAGTTVSDKEVSDYIDKYIKPRYSETEDISVYLNSMGYSSEEDMRNKIEDYLLKQKLYFKAATEYGTTLSEEEFEEEFARHKANSRKVDLKLIFISSEKRSREEALELANNIYTKLQNNENFEVLAKEYSDDSETKDKGGIKKNVFPGFNEQSYDDAVFNAEPGRLLEPIQLLDGYEIVYVEKVTDFYHPKDEFSEFVKVDRFLKSDKYKEWIDNIKKEYRIEVTDSSYKAYRFFKENNYNEAGKYYEKAYTEHSNFFYLDRAVETFELAENWDELIRISRIGIKEEPQNVFYYVNEAKGLYRSGKEQEGLEVLKNAESLSKGDIYYLGLVKNAYKSLGLDEDAARINVK